RRTDDCDPIIVRAEYLFGKAYANVYAYAHAKTDLRTREPACGCAIERKPYSYANFTCFPLTSTAYPSTNVAKRAFNDISNLGISMAILVATGEHGGSLSVQR